jgi:serine/threonine-protein kinase HipA
MLASGLSGMQTFNYTAEQQRNEAYHRASKMSIQGVHPKVSAILNIHDGRFEMVDKGGRYILKPQHECQPQLPENEDLTMRMAKMAGLEVPLHGRIWAKDDSLTYFIKRFDRKCQKDKVPVEDFTRLAGLSRDTKYD